MSRFRYACIVGGLALGLGVAAWEGDLVLQMCDQQARRDYAKTEMERACEYNDLSRECREATKRYNTIAGIAGAEISRLEDKSLIHRLVD